MSMTDREFILALRSVAAEEFTDAIKECEQNPHEFSSEFILRMDTLLRRERRLSWRIMNAITSNVAAALLILALLLTSSLVSPSGNNASSTDFEGALGGVYASAQTHDNARAFIVKQGVSSLYKEDRSSSFKNVVYVNDEGNGFMQECPYIDAEYGECIYNCHIEPYLGVEYSEYTRNQNITH